MELISIIVPIYNVEPFLKECIESIIKQTYQNLEIILVNDGSPDNCGTLCDEYAKNDNRIKVIHKKNGGLSSARNAGLDIATGEYIAFVDSDDCVSSDFIQRLYELCKENSAEIAECDFLKFIDRIEKNSKNPEVELFSSIEMQKRIYSKDYVRTIVVWNKLYHKKIYKNLRFPEGKINEDEFITYKALDSTDKKIAITNETLYYYRYNESSIMARKFNEKRLQVIQAYEERKEYYKNKSQKELYEKTVIEFQEKMKQLYMLTYKYIENNEMFLKDISNRMKKNLLEYKPLVGNKQKIRMIVFTMFPKAYSYLIMLKRSLKSV